MKNSWEWLTDLQKVSGICVLISMTWFSNRNHYVGRFFCTSYWKKMYKSGLNYLIFHEIPFPGNSREIQFCKSGFPGNEYVGKLRNTNHNIRSLKKFFRKIPKNEWAHPLWSLYVVDFSVFWAVFRLKIWA